MLVKGIIGGLGALLLAGLFTPLYRRVAPQFKIMDSSGGRKWHGSPVPQIGGLVIISSSIIPLLLFGTLTPAMTGFLAGGAVIFGIGIIDDIRGVPYYIKFIVQLIAIALFLILSGHQAKHLILFGYTIELTHLYFPVVILWMLGVVNAINLIDGLDSLAGGIGIIILATFGLFLFIGGRPSEVIFTLIIIGATVGFLKNNLPPANLFLGDSGALFLGFIIATLTVIYSDTGGESYAVTIPLLVVFLPVLDTIIVMIKRISKGRNPFLPDRQHIHHVLLSQGIPVNHVVSIIHIMTLSFCILALFSMAMPGWLVMSLFVPLALMMTVLPRLDPMLRASLAGRTFTLIYVVLAGFLLRIFRPPS